jgi:hypothetical protein
MSSPETEHEAIRRLRASVTGDDPTLEFGDHSPFDDIRVLLAEYDRLCSAQKHAPVAWLYESWNGEDDWSKHITFEKPEGEKWQRNIVALYPGPVASTNSPTVYEMVREAYANGFEDGKLAHKTPPAILSSTDRPEIIPPSADIPTREQIRDALEKQYGKPVPHTDSAVARPNRTEGK